MPWRECRMEIVNKHILTPSYSFHSVHRIVSVCRHWAYYSASFSDVHRITNWDVKHRTGSIQYHNLTGEVEVKRAGFYFIYSQMFYFDGTTAQMAHDTYINSERVMGSEGSVIGEYKKLDTKYHGGVFRLRANDRISVRARYTKRFNMIKWGSFFGAFFLHL